MAGSTPRIRLNALQTRTQRDEQRGVANLTKGLFSAFRNPAAHEPRIEWTLSEQDALDFLLNSDKVIVTPHIAGWTHQSKEKLAQVIVDKILANFNAST